MFGIHDLGLFVVSGVLLNLTPGPDSLYVLSRSAFRGFSGGFWAAMGIGAGCFVHIIAAALGISAVLAASATAFTVIKWMGAAYLVYVGITMLRQRVVLPDATASPLAETTQRSLWSIFWQGFWTDVLNPKVALFFLAFVPQFIDVQSPAKVQAFLLLGCIVVTTGTLYHFLLAWAASHLSQRLAAASTVGLWLNRCLGGMFIALGVRLALEPQR